MIAKRFRQSVVIAALFGVMLQALPAGAQAKEFYNIENGELERPTGSGQEQ
jgi:hypothetical protein